MRTSTGPLTDRQEVILDHLKQGLRHKEIAARTGVTLCVVRYDAHLITKKLEAGSTAQAVHKHSTAKAFKNAAAQILAARVPVPVDEVEEHVNHVLEGLAALLTGWHDQRMPK